MDMEDSDAYSAASYRLNSIKQETSDVVTLELLREDGAAGPPHTPGQYNMVHLPEGNVALAICVDPAEPHVLLHTVRVVGSATRALAALKIGSTVDISGPHGCGWPLAPAESNDVVIICGGIGLAPVRPLIYALLQHRERYGYIILVYGARTPEDILFRKELEQWRGRFDMDVLVTVDRATGNWRGHVGVFTSLIPRAPFDPYFAVSYLAGPEVLMSYAAESLEHRGVSPNRQHLYMQRDMRMHIHDLEGCALDQDALSGPVFRYDQIAGALATRDG
jgi:NAD(P)H-flavin reductase